MVYHAATMIFYGTFMYCGTMENQCTPWYYHSIPVYMYTMVYHGSIMVLFEQGNITEWTELLLWQLTVDHFPHIHKNRPFTALVDNITSSPGTAVRSFALFCSDIL